MNCSPGLRGGSFGGVVLVLLEPTDVIYPIISLSLIL